MMYQHDLKKHGKEAALAMACQGGHTEAYTQVVFQVFPKDDVSTIVKESKLLKAHDYILKLGQILRDQRDEVQDVCMRFTSIHPTQMSCPI